MSQDILEKIDNFLKLHSSDTKNLYIIDYNLENSQDRSYQQINLLFENNPLFKTHDTNLDSTIIITTHISTKIEDIFNTLKDFSKGYNDVYIIIDIRNSTIRYSGIDNSTLVKILNDYKK